MSQSQKPEVVSLDHLVLTVSDIRTTLGFYEDVLGMRGENFTGTDGTTRWAVAFGSQKINLHQVGREFEPKAKTPTPGSADLCFLSDTPTDVWEQHLAALGVVIEDGPILRTGATGPITSIYIRDPDLNLIEIGVAEMR